MLGCDNSDNKNKRISGWKCFLHLFNGTVAGLGILLFFLSFYGLVMGSEFLSDPISIKFCLFMSLLFIFLAILGFYGILEADQKAQNTNWYLVTYISFLLCFIIVQIIVNNAYYAEFSQISDSNSYEIDLKDWLVVNPSWWKGFQNSWNCCGYKCSSTLDSHCLATGDYCKKTSVVSSCHELIKNLIDKQQNVISFSLNIVVLIEMIAIFSGCWILLSSNIDDIKKNIKSSTIRIKKNTKTCDSDNDQTIPEPIAIVGIGLRFPEASTTDEMWDILENGKDVISEIPEDRWNITKYYMPDKMLTKSWTKKGAFVKNITMFDAQFFEVSPPEAMQMDPQIRLLLEAAWNAVEDTGLILPHASRQGGVYVGHMTDDYWGIQSFSHSTATSHGMQGNAECMASNRVSFFLNVRGPSITVDTACSSSLVCLNYAIVDLKKGITDWALVGGTNGLLAPERFIGMSNWGILSPDGKCQAFDTKANGYVRAEGAGFILIKRLSDAEKAGDRIYSLILGHGVNHDGLKRAITSPNALAQEELMKRIHKEAGLEPDDIQYFEAHGTGTEVGDAVETEGIGNVLGKPRHSPLIIGSVKTNMGHMEGAAGVVSLIKTALSIYKSTIPRNLHFITPNPKIDFVGWKLRVPTHTEPWPWSPDGIRRGCVNSFGIGGANGHCCLGSYQHNTENLSLLTPSDFIHTLILYSKSEPALLDLASSYYNVWSQYENDPSSLRDFCYSSAYKRQIFPIRGCVVGSGNQIGKVLKTLANGGKSKDFYISTTYEDIKRTKPLVFAFCGQGAQWPLMGMGLYDLFPVFKKSLDRCAAICDALSGDSMITKLRLPPSTSENETHIIDQTINSQPLSIAIQLALVDLLVSFGIKPDACVGHSSGEMSAAYACGALSFEDAMLCGYYRGRVITDLARKNGSMSALGISPKEADELVSTISGVSIAAYNSPSSVTVSGDLEAVEQIEKIMESQNKFYRRLRVTHAFHSHHMHPAKSKYQECMKGITSRKEICPMFSSVYGKYVEGEEINDKYFTKNLVSPVNFKGAIESLSEKFSDPIFLEIGPTNVLRRLISESFGNNYNSALIVNTLVRNQTPLEQKHSIMLCKARLFSQGANNVNLKSVVPIGKFFPSLPHYVFQRKSLWLESIKSKNHRLKSPGHPLLGVTMSLPIPTWEKELRVNENLLSYISDHKILGAILMPAAVYLEMALQVSKEHYHDQKVCIRNARFRAPLVVSIDEKSFITLRTQLEPLSGELSISTCDLTTGNWTKHFSCQLLPVEEWWLKKDVLYNSHFKECSMNLNMSRTYKDLREGGMEYGPAFQCLNSVKLGYGHGLCTIHCSHPQNNYNLHPIFIDGMLQSAISTLPVKETASYLPIGLNSFSFNPEYFSHVTEIKSYVELVTGSGPLLIANMSLICVGSDQPFAWASEVQLRKVEDQKHASSVALYYEMKWNVSRELYFEKHFGRGPIILLGKSNRHLLGQELARVSECQTLRDFSSPIPTYSFALVYFLKEKKLHEPFDFEETLSLCRDLIEATKETQYSCPLVFVTSGCNATVSNASCGTIIGFLRVLFNEVAHLNCKMVDLDPVIKDKKINALTLLDILDSRILDHENEVVVRGGRVFTPRVVPSEPASISLTKNAVVSSPSHWNFAYEKMGSLESIVKQEYDDKKELADTEIEIEIEYTGLSFRDAALGLGLISADAFGESELKEVGHEVAGVVTKVSTISCKHFTVGDRVFALGFQGTGTHTRASYQLSFHIPESLEFKECAGLATPYITAYACMIEFGKVKKGDHVLIHSASGALGVASIQLAHNHGAIVYATASTPEKREYCREIGADYTFHSRNLDFVQEIRLKTKGKGIDLVINTLAGNAMIESLRLVAPFGRFIELGKTDALADNTLNIHYFLENRSYFFFDLHRYTWKKMEKVKEWGDKVSELLSIGSLIPPRIEVYPVYEIKNMIRKISKAQHVGKIVLKIKNEENKMVYPCDDFPWSSRSLFRHNETYLIVGGTRGLGIRVAYWMVQAGARHLCLISRSAKLDDHSNRIIHIMENIGAKIFIKAVDICNKKDLNSLLLDLSNKNFPTIQGILHSAMVLADGFIANMTTEQFNRAANPKTIGCYNLHRLIIEKLKNVRFFIAFSSISSVIGNMGQANYSGGNSYIESLIHFRRNQKQPGSVINLGAVADVGVVSRESTDVLNPLLEKAQIKFADIIPVLSRIAMDPMNAPRQVIICPIENLRTILPRDNKFISVTTTNQESSDIKDENSLSSIKQLDVDKRFSAVSKIINNNLARVLQVSPGDIRDDTRLNALGVDSMMAVEIKNWIDGFFGTNFSVFTLTSGIAAGSLANELLEHVNKTIHDDIPDSTSKSPSQPTQQDTEKVENYHTIETLFKLNSIDITGETRVKDTPEPDDDEWDDDTRPTSTVITPSIQKKSISVDIDNEEVSRFDWTNTKEYAEIVNFRSQLGWNPFNFTTEKKGTSIAIMDGKEMINYTSYDYLGLAFHPKVLGAAKKALDKYGGTASASRVAGGQFPLHEELEKEVANFLGMEDSIVYLGGHTANVNSLKALFTSADALFMDELSHNSILEGVKYSGAGAFTFLHNNINDLERVLKENRHKYQKACIIIEGLYSMDGDIPHLPSFLKIKSRYHCSLMVDEAHSIGVLGKTGHGIAEHFNVDAKKVDIWMGSLGKAFASQGGYIAGTKELTDILRLRAPGFVYSIGLSPAPAASALSAIRTLQAEYGRVDVLHENIKFFKQKCIEKKIDIMKTDHLLSAVVPVFVGSTKKCIIVLQRLRKKKILVAPGLFPAVPHGQARLRFFITQAHDKKQIDLTVTAIEQVFDELKKEAKIKKDKKEVKETKKSSERSKRSKTPKLK